MCSETSSASAASNDGIGWNLDERQQPPHPPNGVRVVLSDAALVVNGQQLLVRETGGVVGRHFRTAGRIFIPSAESASRRRPRLLLTDLAFEILQCRHYPSSTGLSVRPPKVGAFATLYT